MLIGVILIIGCERRIKSSNECSYSHKKNYDPIRVAFDFDKIWSSSLLNDIQPDSSDSEIIKIIYKSNDTSLDTIYQLTVLILMDNKKCYLSYKRRNGKSDSIIKIDRNNHSFKKLKQYINLLPNEHLTRDCLVPAALSLSNFFNAKKRTARFSLQTETLYAANHIEKY